jgi:predicted ribosomally synthesized peptide with nif11-like leader
MSIESAKKFVDRMKTDESFAKKVIACKDAEARKAFVKNEGFDCTVEEVKSLTGEIKKEDLASLSAGVTCAGVDFHNMYSRG